MNKKQCSYCKSELPEEAGFCPYCMSKLIEEEKINPAENTREHIIDTNDKPLITDISYPIEKRTNSAMVVEVISSIFFGSLIFYFIQYTDGFLFVLFVFLVIAAVIGVLIGLAQITVKVYRIFCPYCGQSVDFPVNELGFDCPCCQQRMVMTDGVIKKVEK